MNGPVGVDEPLPLWDVRVITPGVVLTQGRSGRRIWDVDSRTRRAVGRLIDESRDGLLLGRGEAAVTDPKTGEEARVGAGAAELQPMSPAWRPVALRPGAGAERWTVGG